MHVEWIFAVNSGHGQWWYGIPIIAVVLIVRLGIWRRRRGRGSSWRNRDGGPS